MMADMTRTVVTVDKGEGWREMFIIAAFGLVAMTAAASFLVDQRDEARRQAFDALTTANDAMDVAIKLFKTCETP